MGIVDDLADLFLDEIQCVPGTLDYTGAFIPSGAVLVVPCRIEGESRLVRDPSGQEVTSSVQAIVGGYFDLSTERHRYVLPARFVPRGNEGGEAGLRAIAVDKVSGDEDDGASTYEEIFLP